MKKQKIKRLKKSFSEKCYELLKKVPKGKITTYKILAEKLGTKAYRAVGNAMNKNPYYSRPRTAYNKINYCLPRNRSAPNVPCHRAVNSDGKIGGFALGIKKKIFMLNKEGIPIRNKKIKNFEKYVYRF